MEPGSQVLSGSSIKVRPDVSARPKAFGTDARLPLAFIALGVVSLAAALVWLVIEPGILCLPYSQPRVLALVHLCIPGFLLSVCFGACYQMMPVVLGVGLVAGRRRLWSRVVLHAVGTAVLVLGFDSGRYEWVAIGGGVVAHGALAFGSTALRTFARSERRDAVAWSFPIAAVWLMLTVTLGLLLAIDRRWSLFGLPGFSLLRAHAHLGLVGFFLTLLQGVAFQLVPMFTLGRVRREGFVWTGLIATQIGLLTLAPGLGLEIRVLAIVGAGLLAIGIAASGIALVSTLMSRRRARLEVPLCAFLTGAGTVPVLTAFGLAVVASPRPVPPGYVSVYGIGIIMGALGLMLLGMLGKIIPFLVWITSYGSRVGKEPVPAATSLPAKTLERAWLVAHVAGVLLACAAAGSASMPLATAAAWTLAAGGAMYLSNAGRVARHLFLRRDVQMWEGAVSNG